MEAMGNSDDTETSDDGEGDADAGDDTDVDMDGDLDEGVAPNQDDDDDEVDSEEEEHTSPTELTAFPADFIIDHIPDSFDESSLTELDIEVRRRLRVLLLPSTLCVVSDSATPSILNASNFLTVKDNVILNPFFFWNAQLESDPKHTRLARLSLMFIELIAIKIYEIAESGNTGVDQKSLHFYTRKSPYRYSSAAGPIRGTGKKSCSKSHVNFW